MSSYAITNYYNEFDKIVRFGGSKKETSIRNAFYVLLNEYAKQKDLLLVAEISSKTKQGKIITPDGTLKDYIRNDWGYWESKDESDDIDEEIKKKFSKGYPNDNILFEDSQTAVLFQHGEEVMRINMKDDFQLDKILSKFLDYERPEVHDFRVAIEKFKEDIPKVTNAIKQIIEEQEKTNVGLRDAQHLFLLMCQTSINPSITSVDVSEMMIQHILSADIFNTIFDEPHFHQENNIANELNKVISTFFTGNVRKQTLGGIKHYYDTINSRAASIADHHEKQKFLKVVYENFYKGYNPKAADRLGIVYTPNEIVQFMIKGTDFLLHKHFGKTLGDKNVEILDPATGTGTFICDIIDYLPQNKLKHKYKNELHANEVSILPYYIANLNIEYTYKQKMGEYEEFENLCFVDTLDNTGFNWVGKQGDLFGVSAENTQRIKRQNERRISVIIGNPPYNANQQNENDENKNRVYIAIDKRIKDSYIKHSTAQKTKLYDMYSRFYRWAMDRLNDNGIIAFITNRSFIDSKTFDGFRKVIQDEFDFAYIIDTKSDVRANPKIAGTTHNIFGIQTGVAILFLIKSSHKKIKTSPCRISYIAMDDYWTKDQKLHWLTEHPIDQISFDNITPDKNNNWINLTDNDWGNLIDIKKIFNTISNGINTARDEWVFDYDHFNLMSKINFLINEFNSLLKKKDDSFPKTIKWSSTLKSNFKANIKTKILLKRNEKKVVEYLYRPFIKQYYYSEKLLSDRLTANHYKIFGYDLKTKNLAIAFSGLSSSKQFSVLAVDTPFSFDYIEKTQCLPMYLLSPNNNRMDNISNWALETFIKKYNNSKIVKDEIFYYIYAVLHNPSYRVKYELNLKREFPRIPFYHDFQKWVEWGRKLTNLHVDFETATPFDLKLVENQNSQILRLKLKANKVEGIIELDTNTSIYGIPKEAWEYKIANRSILEWVLDQYKEKNTRDKTISEKFDSYRFADYKDQVIELVKKVCTVSVETVLIVEEMKKANE